MRLHNQLVDVAKLLQQLRAHIGYISEFIVHGIVPIPEIYIVNLIIG